MSAEQFKLDLHWLFGAMKQAITGRDRTIIQSHEETQDGIVAWHDFVTKYRCDGNVDVHLNQQMALTQNTLVAPFSSLMTVKVLS